MPIRPGNIGKEKAWELVFKELPIGIIQPWTIKKSVNCQFLKSQMKNVFCFYG